MLFQIHSLLSELSKPHQTILKTKQIHALIAKTRLSLDPFFATKLVRFYAHNDDLCSAHNLFDETPARSVFLWNSIIRAYARARKFNDALSLFERMLGTETKPDNFTYACVVRACCENFDLDVMRLVHTRVIVSGLGLDLICGSALVTGYSKLYLVDEASKVFYGMPERDLALWNSMVSGYGHCGLCNKGLELFSWMRHMGQQPDGYTLVGLISGLVDSHGLLSVGQGLHGFCLKSGFDRTVHVGSSLVSMYSRFKCMDSANIVFSSLLQPDVVAWSSLITGYSQCGEYGKALLYFWKLNMEMDKKADPILISAVLEAAARSTNARFGSEIHGYVVRHGFESNVMVSSALIDMYFKCGFTCLGIGVFEIMPERSTISYNCLISGLGLNGMAYQAFEMFDEMLVVGLKPDDSTFSALLTACCHAGLLNDGWEIFRRMKYEFSIQPRTEHYVHMVKLLGMAGELEEAYNFILCLPKPVDSSIWGAMLSCCDGHGNSELAEVVSQQLLENEPKKGAYRVMLSNIYAGDGRWDDVQKLRGDIAERGVSVFSCDHQAEAANINASMWLQTAIFHGAFSVLNSNENGGSSSLEVLPFQSLSIPSQHQKQFEEISSLGNQPTLQNSFPNCFQT
ncbi:Tetratricopeptide repeat-like superfamily protein, putative [Theobroma cacao]|uniref:Tetratricopeptide repeat-like superfamily protein, putative n=1 Tax=Theobroma cacao TaxID=3641 RepID=A0A061DZ58_THECC|nr:Tetratricopeptide repeat-like superfamily protein, putative [Theobroma cacao]